MTTTALTDAELLTQARDGDEAAFTELYVRHQSAARRLASSYARAGDPDDLVNESFERILTALRRGTGPTDAFRAYLFVTLRRLATDRIHRKHDEPVDDVPEPVLEEAKAPPMDPADRQLVVSAYEALPERWQAVLWQTAVEGRQPRELAAVFGMSANAAAALAYRAREKLRQAYLQAHLQAAPHPECEPHRSRLGAYVRDGLSRRDRDAADAHLSDCEACQTLRMELADVNQMLARSLLPLFGATSTAAVGVAAATAATAGGTVAGAGALAAARQLATRLASKARSNPAVVGGVVAATAVAVAAVSMIGSDSPPPAPTEPTEEEAASPPSSSSPSPQPPPPAPPETEPVVDEPAPEPSVPDTPPGPVPEPPATEPPIVEPPPGSPPPPAPPPPSAGPVVWVPESSSLQVTLSNESPEAVEGYFVEVLLENGAVVRDLPAGCDLSLALIWTAECSVSTVESGASRVVDVPVRVTGPGQAAQTRICESRLLGFECVTAPPEPIHTPLE